MTKIASKCLSCTKAECTNCIKSDSHIYRSAERNKKDCKSYYQRHREECIERAKRNRYKKQIEERGYEMALYI